MCARGMLSPGSTLPAPSLSCQLEEGDIYCSFWCRSKAKPPRAHPAQGIRWLRGGSAMGNHDFVFCHPAPPI